MPPQVQAAARVPYMIGALLQIINGITFIGEGVMIGASAGMSSSANHSWAVRELAEELAHTG